MPNYAFFDVDQTIYPTYTMAEFFPLMIANQITDSHITDQVTEILEQFRSGKLSYKMTGERLIKLLASTLRNYPVSVIESIVKSHYTADKLRPWVKNVFSLLKSVDYKIILVSGSPEPIVKALAESVMVDRYQSSILETSRGIYTGQVPHVLDDFEKKKVILNNYDLLHGHILAFGDSTGDTPMLSLAEHAFIINPHQSEMTKLISVNANWHLVTDENILQNVKSVI